MAKSAQTTLAQRLKTLKETVAARDRVQPIARVATAAKMSKNSLRNLLRRHGLRAPYNSVAPILEILEKAGHTFREEVKQQLLAPPTLDKEIPSHPRSQRYPKEFKSKVLEYARTHSVPEAAAKFGVTDVSVYKWRSQSPSVKSGYKDEPQHETELSLESQNKLFARRIHAALVHLTKFENLIRRSGVTPKGFGRIIDARETLQGDDD